MPAVAEPKPAQAAMLRQYESAEDPIHEEAEKPVVKPAEAVKPEPVKHQGWLLRAAKQAKIDDSEIASMTSAELKEAVQISARHFEDMKQHEPPRPRDSQGRFIQPDPEPEEPFNLKMLGLDPKKWDETEEIDGVVRTKATTEGILTETLAPLMKEIKELKKQLGEVSHREQTRLARETDNELDKLFASKADLFGTGTRSDLKPGSPEWKRRAAIARAMTLAAQEDPSLSFKANFQQQVADLYPTRSEPEPKSKERPDPLGYANGTLHTPTARQEPARAKGRRAAEDFIQERFMGGGDHRAPEADEDP